MELHLEVRSFQETLNAGMCGPASLKIVLGYYGKEVTETELAEKTGCTPEMGTTAEDICKAAAEYGFEAVIQNEATFEDIESWLVKKVPVIVDWFTVGRKDYADDINVPDGHYSVVAGLDDTHIYLQDPEIGGMRKLKREAFERVWFDFSGEYIKPDELIVRQLIAICPSA